MKFSIRFYNNKDHPFRKYPAHLTVTVGPYQPETTGSVSLTRPMSVLEEETTGDIYTCASDGDDPIDEQSHQVTSRSATENPLQNHRNNLNRVEAKTLRIKPRLPGQVRNFCAFFYRFVILILFQFSNARVQIESSTNIMLQIIHVELVLVAHNLDRWWPNSI